MEILFDYKYDLYNIINKIIKIENKNYNNYVNKIKREIYLVNEHYSNLNYGNILKEDKLSLLNSELAKYKYLASLENFYNNNKHYFNNMNSIDFHGLYSQEMIYILDELFNIWEQKNIKKVNIITGRGNLILYNDLLKYLKKWNIIYKPGLNNNITIFL